MPTSPEALITNGVVSVLAASSTRKLSPEPVLVMVSALTDPEWVMLSALVPVPAIDVLASSVIASTKSVKSSESAVTPPALAQVPSPRQKVEDEAEVPLFRLVTGRSPVTPLARLTCAQAGLLEVPVLER